MINYDLRRLNKVIEDIKTPSIVYDEKYMWSVIDKIIDDSKKISNFELFFSVKANRYKGFLKSIIKKELGIDVSSMREYELVKELGFSRVSITSPFITSKEIQCIYLEGDIVDFDSINQLETWCNEFQIMGEKIGVRLKGLAVNMTESDVSYGNNSRFGIDCRDKRLVQIIELHKLEVVNLHFHIGEYLDCDNLKKVIQTVKKSLQQFCSITTINFGGGLTYLYADKKKVSQFWEELYKLDQFILSNYNKLVKFIIEPGMLIAMNAGYLVSRVLYIEKINDDMDQITLDSSAWNLYSWNSKRIIAVMSNKKGNTREIKKIYKIVGSSCYEDDIFFDSIELNEIEQGDKLLFGYSGAYVTSMMRNMHGQDINEIIVGC